MAAAASTRLSKLCGLTTYRRAPSASDLSRSSCCHDVLSTTIGTSLSSSLPLIRAKTVTLNEVIAGPEVDRQGFRCRQDSLASTPDDCAALESLHCWRTVSFRLAPYAAVLKSFGIPSQYVRDLPERLWMAAAKLAKFYRLHPMRRGLRPGCRATFNANRGICSFPLHVRQLA
jgi:hypothetical protein